VVFADLFLKLRHDHPMKKNVRCAMRNIILIFACLALVACGGGDGANQSGSNSSPGSAVFQNFTASSVLSNVCRNFAVPTDSASCAAAGGTWSSRTSYSITSGSIDYGSYSAICSSGVPTTTCRLNGISFSPTAGLSLDAVNACEIQGGTIEVSCSSPNGTENYCNINPNNSSDCSALGGSFYPFLQSVSGSVEGEQLISGNNILQILTNYPALDSVDVMGLNPQAPVFLNYTIKIHDALGFGLTFWSSVQSRATSTQFDSLQGYPIFSVTSPVAVDGAYLSVDNATLYFQ